MQKYIDYLLSDMRQAIKNKPARPYFEISEELGATRGAIEYVNIEPKPMGQWFGIEKISFPPIDKLTVQQIEHLVEAIIKLWAAYNFEPVWPKELPVKRRYELLVRNFDEPVVWVSNGTSHIEFCNYDTKNCPFTEEFCMCIDLGLEEDNDNIIDEFPF